MVISVYGWGVIYLLKMQPASSLQDYHTISVIGKGTYAKVLLVRKKSTGGLYAIKSMKKKYIEKRNQVDRIMIEKDILSEIKHEFLISTHCSFQSENKLFFVLQYCPGGELFGLLTKRRKLTEEQARFYAAQILLAIEYLHSKNIIYRDLKPENILISADGYIKLTDFGLSKTNVLSENEAFSICGTPQYLAPEVIKKQGHGKGVDWWCLGSVIYELVHGLPPFYTRNRNELFESIKHGSPYMSKQWSKNLRDILGLLLEKNAETRMKNIANIRGHPWFQTMNWKDLEARKITPPFVPVVNNEIDVSNFDKEFTECDVESYNNSLSECGNFEGFSFQGRSPRENANIQDKMKESDQEPEYEMMEI